VGRIPEHIVDDVRERADIVGLVSRHVTLRKQGPRHWGLCPFHSEKTPSFQVHEQRQIFYCFGCGAGGDVFSFRMRIEGLDFPDAIRATAREVGVEIPVARDEQSGRVMQLYRVHEAAVAFYRSALRSPEGAAARRYLEERAVSQDLIDRFRIGFAPARWDGLVSHLQTSGEGLPLAEQAGLVARRQTGDGFYDRFRARVVFPILEPGGHVIGFGGRALDDSTPKYLNSPETPVYKKGRALFGLAQATDAIRASRRVVVVEGYFDLLALFEAGIAEAVAPCGTALTPEHAHRLRRHAGEVVLLFDGDEAGERAAERALPLLLAEGLRVRVAFLPRGEDPDTLLRTRGAEALRACIEHAPVYLDHLIEQRIRGASAHAWEKADAARELGPLLRALPDPIERADYVRQVASRLSLPEEALERALASGDRPAPTPTPAPGHLMPEGIDTVSRALLGALTAFPELAERLEPSLFAALEKGIGLELLESLVTSAREHGARALDRLLSPESERLRPELRDLLVAIAAQSEPVDRATAEKVLFDCGARLATITLARESGALQERLRTARDSAEEDELLLAKQRLLEERRALSS
jgi:DNA primase